MSEHAARPLSTEELAELHDARETARLGPYIAEAWHRRRYVWFVSTSELKSRQMNSVLGNLWHLLNPILQIAVFWLIFGKVLGVSRGLDNFVGFLAIGIFTYGYSQRSTMAGARSIYRNRGLIKIISFPRVLLPVTSTVTEGLAAVPTFVVMFAVAALTGETISFEWLLVIPVFLVQSLFNVGLAMFAARAAHRVADVQQVLPFVFRLGFYASGVLFNVESYVAQPKYRLLFEANPFYCFIELNRSFVMDRPLDPLILLFAAMWTVVIFGGGFFWFRAGEDSYGEN